MFKTLRNAFKIKDIRAKLLFTLIALLIVRLGCLIPVPGVDRDYFQFWLDSTMGDNLGFLDALTGGSFTEMSIFALNISPYITSSIIMQLLTIAIPKLEELQKDGEEGRKKIAEISRYLTIGDVYKRQECEYDHKARKAKRCQSERRNRSPGRTD